MLLGCKVRSYTHLNKAYHANLSKIVKLIIVYIFYVLEVHVRGAFTSTGVTSWARFIDDRLNYLFRYIIFLIFVLLFYFFSIQFHNSQNCFNIFHPLTLYNY